LNQACIALIHKEVGTVIQVSKIYETPFGRDAFTIALGFAYVLSAHKVLNLVLKIEKTRAK
jgi:hypothetical protein